jgi:hypothetical protein
MPSWWDAYCGQMLECGHDRGHRDRGNGGIVKGRYELVFSIISYSQGGHDRRSPAQPYYRTIKRAILQA